MSDRAPPVARQQGHTLQRILSALVVVALCIASAFSCGSAGCFGSGPAQLPVCEGIPIEVHLQADKLVNLNTDGQSAPVEVRILVLTEREPFDHLDFFTIWREAEAELGDTLAKSASVTVFPENESITAIKSPPQGKFVALVALFREPDEQEWQHVTDIREQAKACGATDLHIPIRAQLRDNRITGLE